MSFVSIAELDVTVAATIDDCAESLCCASGERVCLISCDVLVTDAVLLLMWFRFTLSCSEMEYEEDEGELKVLFSVAKRTLFVPLAGLLRSSVLSPALRIE